MEELALICRKCGHEEHGESAFVSEIRERMEEHLRVCHALTRDDFELFVRSRYEDTMAVYK